MKTIHWSRNYTFPTLNVGHSKFGKTRVDATFRRELWYNGRMTNKGFTLLELLIVTAVIAILGSMTVSVIQPGERLREARDTQRVRDLATLHKAIVFYVATVPDARLDNFPADQNNCEDRDRGNPNATYGGKISSDVLPITCFGGGNEIGENLDHPDPTGGWASDFWWWYYSLLIIPNRGEKNINGTGWIHIDFTKIQDKSSIATLPVDPVGKLFYDPGTNKCQFRHLAEDRYDPNDGFYYRYTCKSRDTGYKCGGQTWEIDANMESEKFRKLEKSDGGDWDYLYETGTCLYLLPAATCPAFGPGYGCF